MQDLINSNDKSLDEVNNQLLAVNDLSVEFATNEGYFPAVNKISFDLPSNYFLGIVGESGCGKSVTAKAILRILPQSNAIVSGSVLFNNEDLMNLSEKDMRSVRGRKISMIFQEPMTSLNPVFTIGDQIRESLKIHRKMSKKDLQDNCITLLKQVQITDAEKRVNDYPHQLSGGMRQRVMIAMALASNPQLLIADEPTTALDVTVQAEILDLLMQLKDERALSVVLITHDLGIVSGRCKRVLVMYCGQIVEEADVVTVFNNPRHPYTYGLVHSYPKLELQEEAISKRLYSIPGMVPSISNLNFKGCLFYDRCFLAQGRKLCQQSRPDLKKLAMGNKVACHFSEEI